MDVVGDLELIVWFLASMSLASAWNAVITGRKKWILYPPECTPPGVYPTKDGSEVTSPLSLVEW